jgi:hypothetical protein
MVGNPGQALGDGMDVLKEDLELMIVNRSECRRTIGEILIEVGSGRRSRVVQIGDHASCSGRKLFPVPLLGRIGADEQPLCRLLGLAALREIDYWPHNKIMPNSSDKFRGAGTPD